MKIGVIGGNGVAATNRLCDMVERKITMAGAFRDAHHPEMIVWQATTVPSRSMFLEGKGPDWRPDYIRIAKSLKALGCEVGCMCCNTAHYAIKEIQELSGLPFINLLEEVANTIQARGLQKVELWVSDGARKFDIYKSVFEAYAPDTEFIYPSEMRQKEVTRIICSVKTAARFSDDNHGDCPLSMLRKLLSSAVAPVVLGCTDLRVAYSPDALLDDAIAVDSLECLAEKIVALHAQVS